MYTAIPSGPSCAMLSVMPNHGYDLNMQIWYSRVNRCSEQFNLERKSIKQTLKWGQKEYIRISSIIHLWKKNISKWTKI